MRPQSIILVGGPETGKSNYVGRLWASLKAGNGTLKRAGMPRNIEYVESICEHLLQGKFAGRTDTNMARQDFCVPLTAVDGAIPTELIVPDFTGELWRDAVKNSELPQEWMDELESADGALLFVRAHSPLNVQPFNWVTSRDILRLPIGAGNNSTELPTQVTLCELLRLLQNRLACKPNGANPRVAVVVTAWDTLNKELQMQGPNAYLREQFPLFAGMLEDVEDIDVRVYGVSIVGGDLQRDQDFQKRYEGMIMAQSGSVTYELDAEVRADSDVTMPVAWVIGN